MKDVQKIRFIFCEALEKGTLAERETYLNEVCRDNPSLRAEIDALLASQSEADAFFGQPIVETGLPETDISEHPGTVIGRYKLLEKIGEGGMAVVYVAEQEQPVRRRVALKIIKLGMDTKQVIARFEAERQVLAIMDHPNIAKIYDAGSTETGRPYFVMELVKGIPITQYCDENNLSIEKRLKLFITLCEAIQHAHEKGIIHRDIKPTNVLVQVQDGKPLVKVIDFGIAKATNQRLTEKTLFTQHEQLVGTPEYMSPEQAGWGAVDIDPRTDVYSLGLLFYELMTGVLPFDRDTLRRAAFDEICRIIREEDPLAPSTRLLQLGQSAVICAEKRGTTPDMLAKRLHGELGWIPMKALRKERGHRYLSAAELALDVENYLASKPLIAGPVTMGYRFKKLIKRHRVVIAAFTVILIVVLIASIISIFFGIKSVKALRERENSLLSSKISEAWLEFERNNIKGAQGILQSCNNTQRGKDWTNTWNHINQGVAVTRHENPVAFVSYLNANNILSCDARGGVKLWDAESQEVTTLRASQDKKLYPLPSYDISADGRYLLVNVYEEGDPWLEVWDVDRQKLEIRSKVGCRGWPYASLIATDDHSNWKVLCCSVEQHYNLVKWHTFFRQEMLGLEMDPSVEDKLRLGLFNRGMELREVFDYCLKERYLLIAGRTRDGRSSHDTFTIHYPDNHEYTSTWEYDNPNDTLICPADPNALEIWLQDPNNAEIYFNSPWYEKRCFLIDLLDPQKTVILNIRWESLIRDGLGISTEAMWQRRYYPISFIVKSSGSSSAGSLANKATGFIHSHAVSMILVDIEDRICEFDLSTGIMKKIHGQQDNASCIAVTESGQEMAVGSFDGTIKIYDFTTGENHTLPQYAEGITSISYRNNILVSGGSDGSVRVWYDPNLPFLLPPLQEPLKVNEDSDVLQESK